MHGMQQSIGGAVAGILHELGDPSVVVVPTLGGAAGSDSWWRQSSAVAATATAAIAPGHHSVGGQHIDLELAAGHGAAIP
jgi:hypothetical protein